MGLGTLWYIWLVMRGRIEPLLTSWIIFATTMSIGFWSYWNSPVHSFKGNIGNLTGVGSTVPILLAVVITQTLRKNLRVKFNPFQTKCLLMAGGILCLWFALRFMIGNATAAAVSNVLTQILMVVGYVALAERLYNATKNTESLFTWIAITLASLFSMIPAIENSDKLGCIYGIRATITSLITVGLILRLLRRTKETQNASASA